ncbi:MAG: PQQ-binding-like beta-propeller repeat protein, partial [Armatimonadota bacterium]|nr:PQQ-binding-like beta-propeller repeat protein [Armatimonadota bacterium]
MNRFISRIGLAAVILSAARVGATPTENLGIRALPAPGPVVIDGRFNDWDLTGGLFVCDNVETQRDVYNVGFHLMYDANNLYVLARWKDPTPLNNPGSVKGDMGFGGDCLQFRITTAPATPLERTSHWTCWRGREGLDLMDVAYGKKFDQGHTPDAKAEGAQQAFKVDADGKGYVQELAIPWKLLAKDGFAPRAGDRFSVTVEPNFTIGSSGRASFKDIFKPNITLDRVFTFMNSNEWGWATFEPAGHVRPAPVRVADGREFPVRMENNIPVVDWTGVVKVKEMQGFKTINFTMPEDGYVSLILRNEKKQVVRQLLSTEFMTKGAHAVKWDGLTTPNWKVPGAPVPPGDYTWSAIYHKGLGLKLRGWADNAGSAPWDSGPTTNWGGDEGLPSSAACDGEHVYLGWSFAEAGKALVAVDLKGNVVWKNTHGGMAGAQRVAVDNGTVYVLNGDSIYRVDAKTGIYNSWEGTSSTDLALKGIAPDVAAKPVVPAGMDALGGKLYLSFPNQDEVLVLDDRTGKVLRTLKVSAPRALKAVSDTLLYVILGDPAQKDRPGMAVAALNPQTGDVKTVTNAAAGPLTNASAIAVDRAGLLYVGLGEPSNQVQVINPKGGAVQTTLIGQKGGRAKLGRWTPGGMLSIAGMTVDTEGKLWVMEADPYPKRVSVWNTANGSLIRDFFGPTQYGALGGVIDPLDPN